MQFRTLSLHSKDMSPTQFKAEQVESGMKQKEQRLRERLKKLFKTQVQTRNNNDEGEQSHMLGKKVKVSAKSDNIVKGQQKKATTKKAQKQQVNKKTVNENKKENQKNERAPANKKNPSKSQTNVSSKQTPKTRIDKKNGARNEPLAKKRVASTKLKNSAKKKGKIAKPLLPLAPRNTSSSSDEYYIDSEEEGRQLLEDAQLEYDMYEDLKAEEEEFEFYSDLEEDTDYVLEDESCSSMSDHTYDWEDEVEDEEKFLRSDIDDIIIHQGTAIKRPLEPSDGVVNFDSDNEDTQIVELQTTTQVKSISQAREYEREVLLQNSQVEINFSQKTLHNANLTNKQTIIEDEDCPTLVPIKAGDVSDVTEKSDETSCMSTDEDEDDYDDDDEDVVYEECTDSDDWSYISEDVNSKYVSHADEHTQCYKTPKMKADIIHAVGKSSAPDEIKLDSSVVIAEEAEDLPFSEQMARYAPLKAKQTKIITANILDVVNPTEEQTSELMEVEETEITLPIESKSPSLFNTRMFAAADCRYVVVLLKEPLYFYGTLRFLLVAGALDVYGFRPPTGREFELFSPRGVSAVSMSPLSSAQRTKKNISAQLHKFKHFFTAYTLKQLETLYCAATDAIVLLRRNDERNRMIDHFKLYMNENVFPNITAQRSKGTQSPFYVYERQLNCFINLQSAQMLQVPTDWQKLNLKQGKRLLLAGGKAVGKSTLLRYLINQHLNEQPREAILLVDLDVGQNELFAPQTVSCTLLRRPLLGPGCFLNQAPDCAYLVGEVNVTLCAQRYLRAVKLLLEYCNAEPEYRGVPWLVNTMGFNQGIGMELMAAICELVQPTDLVQIQSNKTVNNFPNNLLPQMLGELKRELDICGMGFEHPELPNYQVPMFRLHVLPAAVPQESRYQREWHMSAKDLRYAMLLAAVSDVLQDQDTSLSDRKPWCASLADIKVVCLSQPNMAPHDLHEALTANVVYLCKHTENAESPFECFGIGIVRSVECEQIYMMPATATCNMRQVNCLVLSGMPLPTANLKYQGVRVKHDVLPFVYTADDMHVSTVIKQIYHRPAAFLSGNHKELLA